MKKRRVSTIISVKHWELLKNYAEKYGTQKKVLELALENLEKTEKHPVLSPEEGLWLRVKKELRENAITIRRDLFIELMRTVDFERFSELLNKLRLAEHQVVFHYNKPLKELSLKEVMEGIVLTCRITSLFDSITYTDDGNYYTLRVSHSYGTIKHTKLIKTFIEPLFDAYGAKSLSAQHSNTLLMKIFKMPPP